MQRLNRLSLIHFQALRQNKENENISFFLQACESYGLNKADLFQVSLTSHQAKSKVKLQDGWSGRVTESRPSPLNSLQTGWPSAEERVQRARDWRQTGRRQQTHLYRWTNEGRTKCDWTAGESYYLTDSVLMSTPLRWAPINRPHKRAWLPMDWAVKLSTKIISKNNSLFRNKTIKYIKPRVHHPKPPSHSQMIFSRRPQQELPLSGSATGPVYSDAVIVSRRIARS